MLTKGCPLGKKDAWRSGSNSVVECDLAKVEVAGSNPVSRSNLFKVGANKMRRRRLSELSS
jgi:hypothetical protein